MKKLAILSILSFAAAHADEGSCPLCDTIREYNATHHKNYEYYEDYLEAQKSCPAPMIDISPEAPAAIKAAAKTTPAPKPPQPVVVPAKPAQPVLKVTGPVTAPAPAPVDTTKPPVISRPPHAPAAAPAPTATQQP